jgi:hypothetical protein
MSDEAPTSPGSDAPASDGPRVDRRAVLAAGALAVLAGPFAGQLLSPSRTPLAQAAESSPVLGSWTAPFPMGGVAIHATVTPVGDVHFFGRIEGKFGVDRTSYSATWSYLTETAQVAPLTYDRDIFCAHHNVLPDGRIYITGGHTHSNQGPNGVRECDIYDPATRRYTPTARMTQARWYPTNVMLANGRVLIFGGQATSTSPANTVEEFNPATGVMRTLPASATRNVGLYPRMHLMGNGTILKTGYARATLRFTPSTSRWSSVASMVYGNRYGGTSVLLPGGTKILAAGGRNGSSVGPTRTAEILDTAVATPRWRSTGSMTHARLLHNAVVLPDGKVLVIGGGVNADYGNPVRIPEMFDPATGTWTTMAPQMAGRMYHSTAVLLPDGRVLSAGQDSGGLATYGEIFSPPYLFKGARPTITAAPGTAAFNAQVTVTTPDAASIGSVMLIRPGSVTHQIDSDQRALPLSFTAGSGQLTVRMPANGNIAPPGYYMLFIVNRTGVPSVAKFVRLT